ncbi:MAG: aspartyl-tRNA(Asn)/glutamyl-tRNA(Gln) amidotransferase subunit C [Oceanicoccus sp.]|jgi:aspartyl-tRNA(Asn)/glutamyl-tRNA(Gln) amidotransferase subunit C
MKLTKDDVKKIAHLARLGLTDEEVDRFTGQLADILTFVEQLKEVDTSGVPETCQVTGLANVTREDNVDQSLSTRDELLSTTALPVVDNQIRINRIM